MKKLLILLSLVIVSASFGATKVVGTSTGKIHNELLKRFQNVQMTVYIDDRGNRYVSVQKGIFPVRQHITSDRSGFFVDHLKKGKEWGVKAKEVNLEITKSIHDWSDYPDVKGTFSLTFFSANQAKQTDVILSIHDFDKHFLTAEIYLEPSQVDALISLFEKCDSTIESLKKDLKTAEILN
jgi:hypothetical protein